MKRRTLLTAALGLATTGLALTPARAPAQSGQNAGLGKPFKIFAVLWRGETEVESGFRDYLTQHNIPFEMTVRNLNLDRGNAPPIVAEIKRTRPDLVYTWGTGTTSSIFGKANTDTPEAFVRNIPGLFVLVAYPVAANIVASIEKPGRGVSGVSFLAPVDVQLGTIRAYRPFRRLAVIYDKTAGNSRINVEQLREASARAGMELLEIPVPLNTAGKPDPAALPALVRRAAEGNAEILYMGPDSFITRHSKTYTEAAIAAGLPTFASTHAPLTNSRTMFGLVSDYHTLGKLAASQAERILVDKRRPEDLPVASLSRYRLLVNMDVVHEIGMYPPMDMIPISKFQTSPGA